jgi:hypothetical protein
VLDAWKAAGAKDVPTAELAAVLYAIRPKETFFRLSEPGTLAVSNDGKLTLTADPNGKHRMLSLDPAGKERALAAYLELASQKPVPRQRLRPPQADPKPEPPKPKPNPATTPSSG